ncbi:aspartyl/asparaginyl beta-hydroxylase domain-containing protein [Streptomyces lavendulae]|uniref:Aspartyl/Asparaginyl beta-hydroxylase n=1 Tax=Streptomyces lavendulae subsp. lavendulae TaxID=58340 RepID=A0A2K8PS05_STRLA|nr:aspartyl/asparaginyl beta-hydroxylase domain-containing protein [Streptomyces lavendulae]ATZ22055.1 Aspartyl/Asparaginyl beta-hydroxylase [Streptomyces lavendulae subsp. lavendulae]ATZ29516.1 Aspartyl/Asparaginyl beta-hydroxylase [Streptomyces lavendulae subsp. lavendulae]
MTNSTAHATLPDVVRLLPGADPERLQQELFSLGARFSPQATFDAGTIIEDEYKGWRVLSLRGPDGDPARTDAGGPGLADYADTPFMARVPYTASVLSGLGLTLRAVRYMSLEPGASVGEHTDYPYGLPVGWARLHMPITTNDEAVLVVNGAEQRWQPGELWYANFGRPHHLYNNGDRPRVHLVIDCFCDPALLELFPAEQHALLDISEVMHRAAAVPAAPEDLARLTGPLSVPAAFLLPYADPPSSAEWADPSRPDAVGELVIREGKLVLVAEGEPDAVLEHIGGDEFRYQCWSEERTVAFAFRDGVRHAEFRYRHGSYRTQVTRATVPA